MIKAGILGGETMAAGELTRILLNHPDIDLRQAASDTRAGKRLSAVHRGLVGDTELCFSPALNPQGLDVVFLCGEAWAARRFVESLPQKDAPDRRRHTHDEPAEPLRIIDLTGAFREEAEMQEGTAQPGGEEEAAPTGAAMTMVYGLPEWNRKALVRGATCAAVPSAAAMAVELALLPLAKNMRLEGDVSATVTIASTEDYQNAASAPQPSREQSVRLDPIAPAENRPDTASAAREAQTMLQQVLGQAAHPLRLTLRSARDGAMPRGIVADVTVATPLGVGELRAMYDEAFADHSFVYTVDSRPTALDVANTNKCLLHIAEADPSDGSPFRTVRITAVLDNLLKGSAGNAVHCLNLLFGLSERTGLSLKASAY